MRALSAHPRGDGEDLAGDSVVALVHLAIDLAGSPPNETLRRIQKSGIVPSAVFTDFIGEFEMV